MQNGDTSAVDLTHQIPSPYEQGDCITGLIGFIFPLITMSSTAIIIYGHILNRCISHNNIILVFGLLSEYAEIDGLGGFGLQVLLSLLTLRK